MSFPEHPPADRDPADGVRQRLDDDPYGDGSWTDGSWTTGLPKHRFPALESDPRRVHDAVQDELMLDGAARMNLATFCTT